MAKKKETYSGTNEGEDLSLRENSVLVCTHSAFSICKKNGKWNVIKIEYDVKAEQAGDFTIVATEDSKDMIMERFKILVSQNVFGKEA